MSNKLRKLIRSVLEENYPAGAENNPFAPWNQSQDMARPIKTKHTLTPQKVNEYEWLVKYRGETYLIDIGMFEVNEQLKQSVLDDFDEVPYEEEPDGEGGYDKIVYYDDIELTDDTILSAAEYYIEKGETGSAEDYINGQNFVFKLTKEVAEQIWHVDSSLQEHPEVKKLLDFDELRVKYPHAFSN